LKVLVALLAGLRALLGACLARVGTAGATLVQPR
jgi:hypothetical protein